MKDFDLYRSFYCGLCRELREKYGISGQITLSYDMTFVILLLSGLYEPKTYKGTTRCILHPVRKQPVRKSEVTEYCADMNVLLTYYKCLDDWKDDRKYVKLGYAKLLEGKNNRLLKLYPDKAKRIVELLDELGELEKAGETDVDKMSGIFGHIMEEIFAYRQDEWERSLRRMGFYLGKFIYLLDASRTAVNMIILTLAHHALLFLKPGSILGGNRKIFLILCIALGNILGKNPVIRIDKSCHSQNIQERPKSISGSCKQSQHDCNQCHSHSKSGKLVNSVSSLHKPDKFFSQ